MIRLTLEDIMSLTPCLDWPRERVHEAMRGRASVTASDIIDDEQIPAQDRVWLLLKAGFLGRDDLVLIADEFVSHTTPRYHATNDAKHAAYNARSAAAYAACLATDEIAERHHQLEMIRKYLKLVQPDEKK